MNRYHVDTPYYYRGTVDRELAVDITRQAILDLPSRGVGTADMARAAQALRRFTIGATQNLNIDVTDDRGHRLHVRAIIAD